MHILYFTKIAIVITSILKEAHRSPTLSQVGGKIIFWIAGERMRAVHLARTSLIFLKDCLSNHISHRSTRIHQQHRTTEERESKICDI